MLFDKKNNKSTYILQLVTVNFYDQIFKISFVKVEGDHLSTSTVSKSEEAGRLKDVEESFEDRYCKVKYNKLFF